MSTNGETEKKTDTADELTVARLTYGGVRVGDKGKKFAEFVYSENPEADSLWYAYSAQKWVGFIVGGEYEVPLSSTGAIRRGQARYLGLHDDEELRAKLRTQDQGARSWLDLEQRKRKDGEDNPLNERIDAVADLIKHLPAPQRAGVINYVMYRLSRTW
jgi:hypothetical protein